MKAPQRALSRRSRQIVLNKSAIDTEIVKAVAMKNFAEPATIVGMALRYDS
jgi:hypothetical protein